jgi:hypothetical protein
MGTSFRYANVDSLDIHVVVAALSRFESWVASSGFCRVWSGSEGQGATPNIR